MLLVRNGLSESVEKARSMIMAGIVYVNGEKGRQGRRSVSC